MKNFIGKALVILTLIKNVIVRKTHYKLHFRYKFIGFKEWLYDWDRDHRFKWAFAEENLAMVSGADELCETFSNGKQYIEVYIIAKSKYDKSISKDEYIVYKREKMSKGTLMERYANGATYRDIISLDTIWICPVTLFVLGRYPKYLYIKKPLQHNKEDNNQENEDNRPEIDKDCTNNRYSNCGISKC